MYIVISKLTDSVFKNQNSFFDLKLSIPEGVKSLYFIDNSGWIEYFDKENDVISNLPDWANQCISLYDAEFSKLEKLQTQPEATGLQTL